ncbi:ABC-type multidrug transport system, ATPase component [[Actinomadura] parvosata subsp. kistnae]|uniref:ABC transporter n=1 Tax=[Actinomadura] parvosata subsp. kistnae TaxID=1909395 RepID=A0A1V0AAF1_9ACTN|nr:ATP-binding cassette domain-containing protein [Nonomuraea sp. ATCC 55076]AQZ67200.1 ABC transporter [Nonomuraea sp. ATCC 55076]SPL94587.1 ABC-type multidrug transport system, ATPase component [Actinomadura parvosata subsp. kistnae]
MIHARGLTRVFKVKKESVQAVRGIDLDVEAGQLVAFLGPNGAGKSTTLRMLTTLLPPTSGTATVAGHDVARDPAGVRARIGYVGQRNSAGEEFLVRDELVTQGRCYGLRPREAAARADELLDLLDLAPLARRLPGTLSGGQRRRLDIALGLIHRPDLLFLDEPSTGLDPKSRAEVWEHILRLREAYGTTLFLTTHYLEEADSMAERVVIIDGGRIIADGTAEQLKNDLAGDHIVITTATEREAETAVQLGGGVREGVTVRLRVAHATAALPGHLRTLDAAGVKVVTAETIRPTLDDVFLTLTGRSLTDDDIPA